MEYNIGDYYLIKKYFKEPNQNEFIGKIVEKNENGFYALKIYIFPESTKIGRQEYMGSNEVYSTEKKISYQLLTKMK